MPVNSLHDIKWCSQATDRIECVHFTSANASKWRDNLLALIQQLKLHLIILFAFLITFLLQNGNMCDTI